MTAVVTPGRPFPLVPLLFLSGLLFLNFTGRIILAPLLPLVETDLGLIHGGAGSLFFFQAVGYAFGLLAAGLTAWRFSHHGTITLSAFTLGVALLAFAGAPSLGLMRVCLVVIGVGAGLYLPSGIATIADLTAETQWGRATAIHELAPAIGFITAPLMAELLLRWLSWRGILAACGLGLLLAGVLYARWGQGGRQRAELPSPRAMFTIATDRQLAPIAALFVLAVAAGYGLYAMLPLFLLTERGMDRTSANALVGLSRVLAPPMVLVAGWLTDRLGYRRALATFQCVTVNGPPGAGTRPADDQVRCRPSSRGQRVFFSGLLPACGATGTTAAAPLGHLCGQHQRDGPRGRPDASPGRVLGRNVVIRRGDPARRRSDAGVARPSLD